MNNKINAIIIHGMSCYLDDCFGLTLKEFLKENGIEYFELKSTLHPNISLESWIDDLDSLKDKINENSIFICHSLGTNFIIKYLATNKIKCKAILSVAGGYIKNINEIPQDNKYLSSFIPTDNEFDWCKNNCKIRYNIFSNNDNIWTQKQIKDYTQMLSATPVELNNFGHFGRSSGIKEIPQLHKLIENIINNKSE